MSKIDAGKGIWQVRKLYYQEPGQIVNRNPDIICLQQYPIGSSLRAS